MHPEIILASKSEGRAGLLRQVKVPFSQLPVPVDEKALKESLAAEDATAEHAAIAIAELKAARASLMSADPNAIILGADSLLVLDQQWLDKPGSMEKAREQIELLSGKEHQIVSACVAFRHGSRIWHHCEVVRLTMRILTAAEISHYLQQAGGDIVHSVGAYHVEGVGAGLFERIRGDYFSIIGLPLLQVMQFLRDQKAI